MAAAAAVVVLEAHLHLALLPKSLVFSPMEVRRSSADNFTEMGSFVHDVEGEMLCESTNTKIPYFNAPIYLENKVRDYIHTLHDCCVS